MPVCRRSSLFLRKANIPSPLVLQKYLVIQKKKHRKKEKKVFIPAHTKSI